jgi:hypothetical protein
MSAQLAILYIEDNEADFLLVERALKRSGLDFRCRWVDRGRNCPRPGAGCRLLYRRGAGRRRQDRTADAALPAPAGGGRKPGRGLALTFTNKAATEMRDRILGSLERAASGRNAGTAAQAPDLRAGEKCAGPRPRRVWGLLGHPGRLRITTLDALCASLARQMPYLSRFGSQPGVSEDAEAHYATAARRTLEMVESGGTPMPTWWPPRWPSWTTTPAGWNACWSPCSAAATSGCTTPRGSKAAR